MSEHVPEFPPKLYTKAQWHVQAGHFFDWAAVSGTPVSVLFGDLDNFKAVNDVHGHSVGDDVLADLHKVWSFAANDPDIIAGSLGGDELGIIAATDSEGIHRIGQLATEAFNYYLTLPENAHLEAIPIGISIGYATSEYGTTLSELLEQADRAMYIAKKENTRPLAPAGVEKFINAYLAMEEAGVSGRHVEKYAALYGEQIEAARRTQAAQEVQTLLTLDGTLDGLK